MSEPAGTMIRRGAIAALVVATLVAPSSARTQTAAAAREAVVAGRERSEAALAALDSVRKARTAVLDDSLRIGGRLVRFSSTGLPESERDWLIGGLEGASVWLAEHFGALAPSLVDPRAWEVRSSRIVRQYRELHAPISDGRSIYLSTRSGLEAEDVRAAALTAAGAHAAGRHSTLEAYAASLSFDEEDSRFVRAARDLALGTSSVGRRCAAGAVGACRTVLSPARGAPPLTVWFSREDHRAIVAASEMRLRRDSIGVRRREACLAGDNALCDEIVSRLRVTYPFRDDVRATFAAHAVVAGGEAGLARLDAARGSFDGDPLGLLVHVSGLTEERLIADWQRRVSSAAAAEAQPPVAPLVFSAAFWCGLLLLGASRRRPR
jgi:hypothetical protein